jgi:hypothetical protein
MRLLCLSGINITGRNGATSAIYLALHPHPEQLDPTLVYHSEINILGKTWTAPYRISMPTQQSLQKVQAEMDMLWHTHRPHAKRAVREA